MWRIIVLLVLGLVGCTSQTPAGFSSTDITGSSIGTSLTGLKDSNGQERNLSEFHDKVVVIFFGYTSCPDVCPTTLARLAEVMKQLGPDSQRLQVILVSVDPETDTPDRLGRYVISFHPAFIGLRGDLPATEAVARDFKVFFSKSKGGHHGSMVDHTTGAYIFDRSGRVRLFVKDDFSPGNIAGDVKRLLSEKS